MRISDWSSDVCSSDLIGFRGERWIHEPAAVGGKADEYRCEEAQPPDRISPKGISREARKRQVARRAHLRPQQDARRLDRGHRAEEHHHRAVHGEDLIIGILWKNLRSEDPTSELKSLMRTSYAVFCLT